MGVDGDADARVGERGRGELGPADAQHGVLHAEVEGLDRGVAAGRVALGAQLVGAVLERGVDDAGAHVGDDQDDEGRHHDGGDAQPHAAAEDHEAQQPAGHDDQRRARLGERERRDHDRQRDEPDRAAGGDELAERGHHTDGEEEGHAVRVEAERTGTGHVVLGRAGPGHGGADADRERHHHAGRHDGAQEPVTAGAEDGGDHAERQRQHGVDDVVLERLVDPAAQHTMPLARIQSASNEETPT